MIFDLNGNEVAPDKLKEEDTNKIKEYYTDDFAEDMAEQLSQISDNYFIHLNKGQDKISISNMNLSEMEDTFCILLERIIFLMQNMNKG